MAASTGRLVFTSSTAWSSSRSSTAFNGVRPKEEESRQLAEESKSSDEVGGLEDTDSSVSAVSIHHGMVVVARNTCFVGREETPFLPISL